MTHWYDKQGRPLPVEEAAPLFADMGYKRVAEHHEGGFWVSTVWVGLDLGHGSDVPLIFETMIFGPEGTGDEQYCERYPTEAAALAGHDQAVEYLREHLLGGADQ